MDRRTERLAIRLTSNEKRALIAAAGTLHLSLSEFVRQSALSQAAEALPDRQAFLLSADDWGAFTAALSAPRRDLPRLRALLDGPSVFNHRDRQS